VFRDQKPVLAPPDVTYLGLKLTTLMMLSMMAREVPYVGVDPQFHANTPDSHRFRSDQQILCMCPLLLINIDSSIYLVGTVE
jgi:hypothetical protein